MDVNDIINPLNRILDLGDQLDSSGGGVQGLTNGEHTTREFCKLELGQFLLYIADAYSVISDAQTAILNLVLGDDSAYIPAHMFKGLTKSAGVPDPSQNMTLRAFQQADSALSQLHKEKHSSLAAILVSTYEAFGRLMMFANENPIARSRFDAVISGLRARTSSGSSETRPVTIEPDSDFVIQDGVLTGYNGSAEEVAIPDSVTRIEQNAFSDRDNMRSVVIPDSVKSIGANAFRHCDKLASVNLPEGISEIGPRAFIWCGSLASVEIPSTVKRIGDDAFCFCSRLKCIKMPASLTDIGSDAFMYCSNLETVIVYGGSRDSAVLDAAKEHFPKKASVIWEGDALPPAKKPSAPRKSRAGKKKASAAPTGGVHTESYNDEIRFELPDDYQMIWEDKDDGSKACNIIYGKYTDDSGNTAYRFSATLSEGDIESSEEDPIPDGEKPFDTLHRRDPERKCLPLSSAPEAELHMKETPVNFLGRQLKYYGLFLLVQVAPHKLLSVTTIDAWDEENPDKNVGIYRHMIAVVNSLRYKGRALPALTLSADELLEQLKPDFEGKRSLIRGRVGLQIKNGDEVVSESVLFDDDEADAPMSGPCEADGKYADYEIENGRIKGANDQLTRIEIPDGVTAIDDEAFRGYERLTEVVVPASVKSIGEHAFSGCKKLKGIVIPPTVGAIGRCAFNECRALTEIVIPEGIETLEDFTFSDCSGLTSVALPSTLTTIEDYVFDGCERLERIVIPSGIESIGENAFGGCRNLREIALPAGLAEISRGLFEDCESLKNVRIPSSVTSIGEKAFYGCSSLTAISFPEAVTALGNGALRGCSSLASIAFPRRLDAIADSLCAGCSSLRQIVIPESVETIGDMAFSECAALTEVTIPDGVKSIGDFAFDDCDALRRASLPGGIELGSWAFPDEVDVTYRLRNGRTTRRKPDSAFLSSSMPSSRASGKMSVGKYTAVMPADELYSHYGKLKREIDRLSGLGARVVLSNGEEYQAIDIDEILEGNGHGDTGVYRKLNAAMSGDRYDLDQLALKMAQIFRVNRSAFNSRHDDEGDIQERLMDKKWKFSALRSFAWTLADLANREGKSIDDYDYDELVALCDFIEGREWLNYEGGSWFDGLCGHPDIHVFYMPGKMIESGEADEICSVLKYNPIASLDAFRSDLSQLQNAMIRLHNGLLKTRNRNEKLESTAAAVLQAWCVMAVSARAPFFSEDGPMFYFHEYPSDALNTRPLSVGASVASISRAAPKPGQADASSEMARVSNYKIVRGLDGKERIKLGEYPIGSPITWLVLENNTHGLLLLSEFALDAMPFCEVSFDTETTNEWHGCTLRTWLNDDFYNEAFSDEEREMIQYDTHDTYKRTSAGEEQTAPEMDKVFLLSAQEAFKYFPQARDRICRASAYAKEQGAEIEAGPNQCSWWLRSPAVELMGMASWAPSIRADGESKGWGIYAREICVRPVIRVRSSKIETGGSAAAAPGPASDRPLSEKDREVIQRAQNTLQNMQSQFSSTSSALEKHQESLRKQEEEKERRIAEAREKGKSSHDEVDMLAVLLIEEAHGKLNRDEEEFAQICAEDFAAYDKRQLINLRRKVMPTIHDASAIEAAKEDMLSRPLEERFSISTANHFNMSPEWDLGVRAHAAIEATKLWYRESEMPQLRQRMQAHVERARQRNFDQLTNLRAEWSSYNGLRGDLHISISTDSDPVPEANHLFHVKLDRDLDVRINLTHPALGFLVVPLMDIFASIWKVSPEEIWDAALQNSIEDSRGQSHSTRSDAMAAKARALSQLKPRSDSARTATNPAPVRKAAAPVNPNAKRIQELEASIAALRREADSIRGLFGFVKKNKLQKEIEAKQRELESLKSQRH